MISVKETDDIGYVKEVLYRPGMGKLCSGGGRLVSKEEVDATIDTWPCVFLVVSDGGERRGFISFTKDSDNSAYIHVALQTRGQKTLDAVMKALAYAHRTLGLDEIKALHPDKESLNHLAEESGFSAAIPTDTPLGVLLHRNRKFND